MARSPARRDARDRRDRDYRRRSRSRDGPQRRHDDRYDDRSYGRYHDTRDSGRPRSSERKRSRGASPVRERRAERHRDDRHRDDRHHDERDSKRPRLDGEPSRRRHRENSRDRRESRGGDERSKESFLPPSAETEEEVKRARQARVEAWKRKQLLKNGVDPSGSPQGSDALSPAVTSPLAESSSSTKAHDGANDSASAAPTKKFDPKAIAKRAAAALEREKQKATLGSDITIPKSTDRAPAVNASKLANNQRPAQSSLSNSASTSSTNNKISGFGLSAASAETKSKSAVAVTSAPLGEEEEGQRKLEKLPDMPMDVDAEDTARAEDSDDPDQSHEIRSDEEEAEAVRQAAQKRAAEAQARDTEDVEMTNARFDHSTANTNEGDDQIDPLDAFMSGLEQSPTKDVASLAVGKTRQKAPQVFDNEDDGANLDAMGDDTDELIAAAAAKGKRKEIPQVDHTKMHYEPFRKNFYSESVDLSEMTAEDVDALRADLDNIKCRGVDVPKPILKWSQGGFGAQILDVIREQKFDKPTSIQSQALPAIMSGRDVIGIAKTGSGKTVAFILPMFRHIKDQRPLSNLEGPIGVVVAPTRELATQIHRECKPYLRALNLRAVCAYGGAPIKDQIAELKRGAEVVVCTPGRMIDLLAANSGRVLNLARVSYVVLDEADRMFDMGFEPQITRILNRIRPHRQTVLFSATFPRGMEALARKALDKPIEILVGGRSVVASEVTQIIEVRSENTKFNRTLHLLGDLTKTGDDVRCLIFVERQETADSMLKDLCKVGYPCLSIHGGREQIDRDQAISDFKAGAIPIMIATSVAARGLDVKQLKLVINYDAPNHVEDYVHRSGRTGRAGETGTAVTFLTPEQDKFAPFLVRALRDSKQEIPESLADLAKSYEQKIKSGDAKKTSAGFGGRGIERLDAARDAEKAVQKKQYKTDDDPEDDDEKSKEKSKEEKEAEKMLAKVVGGVKASAEAPVDTQSESKQTGLPSNLAKHLSNAMVVQKAEPPAPRQSSSRDPMAKVKEAAAKLNNKIGVKAGGSSRSTVPTDNRGPDAGAYHSILEINDFPQTARWKVTNRTNVAKILEATGTSITSKGEYYPPGTEPGEGKAPKLYILVEGDTEVVVESAMSELTRLLKEGTIEALTKSASGAGSGRYIV